VSPIVRFYRCHCWDSYTMLIYRYCWCCQWSAVALWYEDPNQAGFLLRSSLNDQMTVIDILRTRLQASLLKTFLSFRSDKKPEWVSRTNLWNLLRRNRFRDANNRCISWKFNHSALNYSTRDWVSKLNKLRDKSFITDTSRIVLFLITLGILNGRSWRFSISNIAYTLRYTH